MGFFSKSKEDKDHKADRSVLFTGTSLQPIGKIQQGWLVELTLNPDERKLHLKHKQAGADITIPYERLLGFTLEDETTLAQSGGTLGRALVGGVLFGAAGAVVGGMSGKGKTKTKWYGSLSYEDKDGNPQELHFEDFLSGKNVNLASLQFKNRVNAIAAGNRDEVTEL